MTPRHLHAVDTPPRKGIDIHALLRADIKARNWGKVHVAGDRGEPVFLGPRITMANEGAWYSTRREG